MAPQDDLLTAPQDTAPTAAPSEARRRAHLLKVADSIMLDATDVWADLWTELQTVTNQAGMITPEAEQGFVPSCGWPEFLEKFTLLKHYLDAGRRICKQ